MGRGIWEWNQIFLSWVWVMFCLARRRTFAAEVIVFAVLRVITAIFVKVGMPWGLWTSCSHQLYWLNRTGCFCCFIRNWHFFRKYMNMKNFRDDDDGGAAALASLAGGIFLTFWCFEYQIRKSVLKIPIHPGTARVWSAVIHRSPF